MRPLPVIAPGRQQGMALVIALIFLVVLTLLGATVASNNALQERMAGNTRNRDLAFQSAEHALKTANSDMVTAGTVMRSNVDNSIASGACTAANGFLCSGENHDNTAYYWSKPGGCGGGDTDCFHWNVASNAVTAGGMTASLTATSPQYVVEQMPSASSGSPPTTAYYFRVTARGVGKSPNSVVILQTMYKFQ